MSSYLETRRTFLSSAGLLLAGCAAGVRAAAELDPRLEDLAARLAGVEDELAESAAEIRRYAENIDAEPRRLQTIEDRLAVRDHCIHREAEADRGRVTSGVVTVDDHHLFPFDQQERRLVGVDGGHGALDQAADHLLSRF